MAPEIWTPQRLSGHWGHLLVFVLRNLQALYVRAQQCWPVCGPKHHSHWLHHQITCVCNNSFIPSLVLVSIISKKLPLRAIMAVFHFPKPNDHNSPHLLYWINAWMWRAENSLLPLPVPLFIHANPYLCFINYESSPIMPASPFHWWPVSPST